MLNNNFQFYRYIAIQHRSPESGARIEYSKFTTWAHVAEFMACGLSVLSRFSIEPF